MENNQDDMGRGILRRCTPWALVGGHDVSGEPIYVARVECREDLAAGKLIASQRCTFVTWKGEELKRYSYEVLVGSTNIWVPASGSKFLLERMPVGIPEQHHDRESTTVSWSFYIAFDGQELSFSDYEALTY